MSKQYTTSEGWVIDLRKLRPDDRLYIRCHDGDPVELQAFIDQCASNYFGRDIRKQPLQRAKTATTTVAPRTYYTICHLCGNDTRKPGDTNAQCDGYRWCGCGFEDETNQDSEDNQ